MNLVNVELGTKAYGPRVLLDRVSLGVAAGDRIGVVGRNGAGKTTLLEVLAGGGRAGLGPGQPGPGPAARVPAAGRGPGRGGA